MRGKASTVTAKIPGFKLRLFGRYTGTGWPRHRENREFGC